MTKEYIASCLPCSAAVADNPPAPIIVQEMPERPWQVLETDYKGPIGGPNGYYIHVLVNCYGRYPEIAMMKSTSFEKLKPKLDKIWARHGLPDTIIHDGGAPYTRAGREVRPRQRLGEVEKVRLSPRNRKRKMTEAKRAQKEGRK